MAPVHQDLLSSTSALMSLCRSMSAAGGLWSCVPVERNAAGLVFVGWVVPRCALPTAFEVTANGVVLDRRPCPRAGLEALRRFELAEPLEDHTFEVVVPERILSGADEVVVTYRDEHGYSPPAHQQIFWSADAMVRPGPANMQRVVGSTNAYYFDCTGYTNVRHFEHLLDELVPGGARGVRTVLDWGCGAGRVLRYVASRWSARATGADIDPVNVAWCQENLGDLAEVHRIESEPPTRLADGTFDLVYGLSVMTHLSREDQRAWLAELSRITTDDAIVILTLHDETTFMAAVNDYWLLAELAGAGFLDVGRSDDLDEGAPALKASSRYRNVFNTERHVLEQWSTHFRVVGMRRGCPIGQQSYVVLRKRSSSGA
jgi:SAM-dependent methyltransferase